MTGNGPYSTEEYLQHLQSRNYSPKSIDSYRGALRKFTAWLKDRGIIKIQDVRVKDLEKYRLLLVRKKYAPESIRLYLRAVRGLFAWLHDRQKLFEDPAGTLQLPDRKMKLQPVPNPQEMGKLLMQPDVSRPLGLRDRAMLEVAYSSGIRVAELAGLTIHDPDVKHKTIRVQGKGNRERLVPLGKKAVYWLEKYFEHGRPALLRGQESEALWVGMTTKKALGISEIQRRIIKPGFR